MPDPVLLTGATGFVGRAILGELLSRSIPVVAISRVPQPSSPEVTWVQADLMTPEDRVRVAGLAPRLIHAAWEVEHGVFWTSLANEDWRQASLDLIRRFRNAGGGRIVVLGTCAEYDAMAPGPWDETRPIGPATPYGAAKAGLHADLGPMPGLVWARLFHLFGPGEDPRRLIPSLIAALRRGEPAEIKACALIRDYASTGHVAKCLVSLLEAEAQGAFDIGSGQSATLADLGMTLAELFGRPDLLRLTHEVLPGTPPVMEPRLQRLKAAIGPCGMALRDGLRSLTGR